MAKTKQTKLVWIASALALLSACGTIKSLAGMRALQQKLRDKYHEREVGVNIHNNQFMNIVFVNSPLNQRDMNARLNRARSTAKFVSENYPETQHLKAVTIAFIEEQTRLVVFHKYRSVGWFPFNNRGEPLESYPETSVDPGAPVLNYDPAANATDVSIMRIQLEGDLKQGVALTPYFVASGNWKDGKLASPDYVTLDFASYSNEKIFPANPNLEIRANDVPVFTGQARLLSQSESKGDDSAVQFITTQIPFDRFDKMANARTLKITLGPKSFELSDNDRAALAVIRSYVR